MCSNWQQCVIEKKDFNQEYLAIHDTKLFPVSKGWFFKFRYRFRFKNIKINGMIVAADEATATTFPTELKLIYKNTMQSISLWLNLAFLEENRQKDLHSEKQKIGIGA